MIKTTTRAVGKQLEKALRDAGYRSKSALLQMLEDWFPVPNRHPTSDYTLGELIGMIPRSQKDEHHQYMIRYEEGRWSLIYYEIGYGYQRTSPDAENACDAMAKIIMWCIENGHPLKLEKI